MLESKLKKEIREYVKSRGAFWSTVTGGVSSKPGDPDLILCYKGRYVALEVKQGRKKAEALQAHRLQQIHDAGGMAAVVRSIIDVELVLDAVDKGRRPDGPVDFISGQNVLGVYI